jgi:16S rRNA (cytosine1402-N4)-methyltransferase
MGSETSLHMHVPVMADEIIGIFGFMSEGFLVDATLGLGGHSDALLRASSYISLLGIDADIQAVEMARERLVEFDGRSILKHGNYVDMHTIAREEGIESVFGVLLDLGLSSFQLASKKRGFSFMGDGPLDMRFDQSASITASDIVNKASREGLANIFFRFGEEKKSRQIADLIVRSRPVNSTGKLAALVEQAVGKGNRKIHPATKVFQALRIAVNSELDNVINGLKAAVDLVETGGKIVVLSYHSLEDRVVKNFFRDESKSCICPQEIVVCQCEHVPSLILKNKRVLRPNEQEVRENPRSRSVRLRVAEKI